MIAVLIGLHVLVCVMLIVLILVQAGRGGGLVESFQNMESVLGAKTNEFLTRATSVFAVLFFVTCVVLALVSARQSRSLLKDVKPAPQVDLPSAAGEKAQDNAATPSVPVQTTPAVPQTTNDAASQQGQ